MKLIKELREKVHALGPKVAPQSDDKSFITVYIKTNPDVNSKPDIIDLAKKIVIYKYKDLEKELKDLDMRKRNLKTRQDNISLDKERLMKEIEEIKIEYNITP